MSLGLSERLAIPFTFPRPLDETFAHVPELVLEDTEQLAYEGVARYRSELSGAPGMIELSRRFDVSGLGCATFTGPLRAELAFGIATAIPLIPIDVLHAMARCSPEVASRLGALKVIARTCPAYGTPRAAREVETTIRLAMWDADPAVRAYAPLAAAQSDLSGALAALAALREREREPEVLAMIDQVIGALEVPLPPADPEAPARVDPRLALAYLPVKPLADMLRAFPPEFARTDVRDAPEGVMAARLSDLAHRDAHVYLLDHPIWSVGGAYFSGQDRIGFAYRAANAIRYLPNEVAKPVALHSSDDMRRARALLALTFASLATVVPAPPRDPELDALLLIAAGAESEILRGVAVVASLLLAAGPQRATD